MRYDFRHQLLKLSNDPLRNVFRISGDEFFLENLDDASFGGNSCVFRAVHPDGDESYIVKFCRYQRETTWEKDQKRIQRFEREIQALTRVGNSKEWRHCAIPIIDHGVLPVSGKVSGEFRRATLRYYVMVEAQHDLRRFLEGNEVSFPQKLLLCHELISALKGLHEMGIYHRDIKPANILMLEERAVFSDLGLINFRDQDQDIDEFSEKIGPIGYLSPEATNKHLAIRARPGFSFDCWIDDKSDLFQLGQVFWLILQDEVPTGHLEPEDVRFPCGNFMEEVIRPMLQYSKPRRASLSAVELALEPIMRQFAVA